jgi:diaminopropionate ammonia-lyase
MTSADSLQLFINPNYGVPGIVVLPSGGFRRAKAAITAWPGYAPTPLIDLPPDGVAALRLKNEGPRFGLGSFKALGGAYAVEKLVAAENARGNTAVTVTCATDGNHGRSVAWGAQRCGCRCVIFVHEAVSQGRVDAIAAYGAPNGTQVIRVPGNYDDSVREADRQAQANGWFVISDTSYPGYTEVPRDVMQGYRLMADEVADQWTGAPPTHAFIQAGVGGAAAAVSVQMRARFSPAPRLIVVEPETAACLYESAIARKPTVVEGALETIMAGLACGEPSLLAWQELERAAFAFMTIPDRAAAETLRDLADQGIAIGESGVAGLAAFRLARKDPDACSRLELNENSRIVGFGTEGITDRVIYERIRSEAAS